LFLRMVAIAEVAGRRSLRRRAESRGLDLIALGRDMTRCTQLMGATLRGLLHPLGKHKT
jgi:hypothetical protein